MKKLLYELHYELHYLPYQQLVALSMFPTLSWASLINAVDIYIKLPMKETFVVLSSINESEKDWLVRIRSVERMLVKEDMAEL